MSLFRYSILFLVFSLTIISNCNYSQENVQVDFINKNIEIDNGKAVSNICRIINNNETPLSFTVSISHPEMWKVLGDKFKVYDLQPFDSIFLPVRIIPLGNIEGNSKYIINIYVIDAISKVGLTADFFYVKKPKKTKWELIPFPERKLYLKNGESEKKFAFKLRNLGTQDEAIVFNLRTNGIHNIVLTDTNNKPLKKLNSYHVIKPNEDTILYYNAKLTKSIRNFRRKDIEALNDQNKTIKYRIFSSSKLSILNEDKKTKNSTIEIIDLPNRFKENPFSKPTLPATINSNITNLLSARPIANLFLTGNSKLLNDGLLSYNVQTFLSALNNNALQSLFLNINYFKPKYSISIGNVSTGIGLGGRGIMGSYKVNQSLFLSTFFSATPRVLDRRYLSLGLSSRYRFNNKSILSGEYARSIPTQGVGLVSNFYRVNASYSFLNQGISLSSIISSSRLNNQLIPTSNNTYTLSLSYRINYLRRVSSSLSGTASQGNPGAPGAFASSFRSLSHLTRININDRWSLNLQNNYNLRDSFSLQSPRMVNFNNRLVVNGKINNTPFNPVFFYNYYSTGLNSVATRGLSYTVNISDFQKNIVKTINIQTGFKKKLNDANALNNFFFITYLLYRYRVWTANIRYQYGSFSTTELLLPPRNNTTLQTLALSLNHQYQFKNPKWILNNIVTYRNIRNQGKNTINLVPQFYFLTKNELRISINPGIFWSYSRPTSFNSEEVKTSNTSMILNFGLKKKIGIPIPKAEQLYTTTKFCAFIDNNGNHIKDENESFLENVVIRLGNNEIISNEFGEAEMINIEKDSIYDLEVFSIEKNLNGYFPYYKNKYYSFKDSIFLIPFVKGVKVYGEIFLDRDNITRSFSLDYDLSKIKITAYNGIDVHTLTDNNGKFFMYIPFGMYKISIDENVLGSRFKILQNNFDVNLDEGTESVFVTFYLVEKRKKITIKKF
jgi:hypothetical protein